MLRLGAGAFAPNIDVISAVYRTAPWGPIQQPNFYNLVLLASDGETAPQQWLDRCRAAEVLAGRVRGDRFGPRTLDADVICVDEISSDDAELTLPHPRAHQRAFVLIPWLAVQPDAVLPGYGPVSDLVAALPGTDRAGVVELGRLDEVDPTNGG